jgi:Zn-dependent peptidase ImmA (M78 family)/transcriptional regulator with XRE-family HTH domain
MALPIEEIGRRIRTVREQVGILRSALAEALGTDEATVERLEAGTLVEVPGDYVLIAARLLHTDFRYFISTDLDDVEEETRQVYRAMHDPSAADRRAIWRFINFCTNESELEELLMAERRPLPPTYPPPDQRGLLHKELGARAASRERQRLQLGNQPIDNIFDLLRSQGVRLCRHRLEESDVSGLTAMHPKAGVSVLVNYDDDLFRQFFSAAHEYCHVLFERDLVRSAGCVVSSRKYRREDLIEIRANVFAAEFLLPTDALDLYPRPNNLNDLTQVIERIARDYRVNTETVAIRTRDRGWISEKTLSSFRAQRPVTIPRHEKRDPDIPSDLSDRQVERRAVAAEHGISAYYLELLRRAVAEGVITFGRFAEMLDLVPHQAAEFVQQIGIAL